MSEPIFKSNRSKFNSRNEAIIDMLQSRMAMDIEVGIKTTAGTPVDTGAMKSEVRHFKNGKGHWRVEAGKEYSAYQERGMESDGSRMVRRYTTAGTGAGWFRRAIERVWKNKIQYIAEVRKAFDV